MKYIYIFLSVVLISIFAFNISINAEDKTSYCVENYQNGDALYCYLSEYYYANGQQHRIVYKWDYTIVDNKKVACYMEGSYVRWVGLYEVRYDIEYFSWFYDANGTDCEYTGTYIDAVYPSSNTYYYSTNVPIFESSQLAEQFVRGEIDAKSALNYKKVYDNGVWVTPFDDIEINDSNMSSPQLSNVSHNGFTVVNIPDERYMVDIYMESGIQNPYAYEKDTLSVGDALFLNNFGLVSDVEGAYTGTIDILKCYGVDNVSALNQSTNEFYSTYSCLNEFNNKYMPDAFGSLGVNSKTWSIWGQPSGKNIVFFNKLTTTTTTDCYSCPLAFTNYKVRYFYFDDESGFHYGPWTNFIYFSDGRVMSGEVFQGNDGNVIETPLNKGEQDASGNVSFNASNFIDLDNPNELFGYIRSVINNVNATGNGFMTLFANVFSFIPSDVQAIIWLGIGCMVLVGVVKALRG